MFKLTANEVIVKQKGSNGDWGRTIILLTLFAQKLIFGQRYRTGRCLMQNLQTSSNEVETFRYMHTYFLFTV